MLIALLLLAPAGTTTNPPITISFSEDGRYLYGDKAKVYLQTARDGYVVVLRSDARGNVQALSPLDPGDDQQIQAGTRYEAKGRGGREAFVVEDTSGQGVVLAAWSQTPFDLSRFERNTHWDLEALGAGAGGLSTEGDNTESRLLGIVDAIKPDGHYQYDAATYVVFSPRMARATVAHPYALGWSPVWWGYGPWWPGPYFGTRVVVVPGGFRYVRHR